MLHILIVDDSPATREITAEQVRALGHRASLADDGSSALALLDRGRYDVVLMDLRMPGMDGLETTRRICSLHAAERPRIVALSGGDRSDHERCMAAGMDGFLTRPASLAQLRAALDGRPPPPRPSPAPGVFDATYVDELLAAIGQADLRSAAAPFIGETPQLLAALRGYAPHSASDTVRIAHLLKGRALSLGATALAAQAGAIERLATAGVQIEPDKFDALDDAFAAAVVALRAHLGQPRSE